MPDSQAGGQPLVGYLQLLIQCIRSYPPCLEGISSICSLMMCHVMAKRDQLNMDHRQQNGLLITYVLCLT
jgi:hypothetical protein